MKSIQEQLEDMYQDVIDASPHQVAEIIDGILYMNSRSESRHAFASSGIGNRIGPPYHYGNGGPGNWWIIDGPELHLGYDILVPDLAGWSHLQMPQYPDVAYFSQVPTWICEVLSPSTRALDLGVKREVYAREGVVFLWLVDPDTRTLEAFRLTEGKWLLLNTLTGNDRVCLPPFFDTSFYLGDLWPGDDE